MENISIKLDSSIARQIESVMDTFHYSTKTEFIRDAIRDKLKELDEKSDKKKAFYTLIKAKGLFAGKGKAKTDAEFKKLTRDAGLRYIEKLEKNLNQK